jgi:integrase/recombinase XerD
MTDFAAAAADYLATRRAMGYKLAYQGTMLMQFAAYLDAADAEHLTIAHALAWARQPVGGSVSRSASIATTSTSARAC